jgi:tRNA-dihydrouridine synthase
LDGNPTCMVIGNWWIKSYMDAQSKFSEFGLDWIMIWQSSIWNPRIFTTHKPTIKERCDTILKHLDYSIACDQRFDEKIANKPGNITVEDLEIPFNWIKNRCDENRNKSEFRPHSIVEFRKFLFQYVKWISWSKEWKQHVLECKDYKELKKHIISLFEQQ